MSYDYSKLNGRITEICGSQKVFSQKMNWSEHTTSVKLTGKVPWSQKDIKKAIDVLGLNDHDIQAYFFTLRVQ